MSKYERLFIYLLLFVALFYGLTGGQPFVTAEEEIPWYEDEEFLEEFEKKMLEKMEMETEKFKRIEAREILLVDKEGNSMVYLGSQDLPLSDRNMGVIRIADAFGKKGIDITGGVKGGAITIGYDDGKLRLSALPDIKKPTAAIDLGCEVREEIKADDIEGLEKNTYIPKIKGINMRYSPGSEDGVILIYDKYGEDYRGYGYR